MIIRLSDTFKLRPHQRVLFDAYFNKGIKNFVRLCHRRAGKSIEAFMLMFCAALTKRGVYAHLLPTYSQSKKVIWQNIGEDGIKLLDRLPDSLVVGVNHSEQKISLVNGSIIYIAGSDNYKRLVGMGLTWVTYDEYQDANPAAVDAIRPMIRRSRGTTFFVGTPRAYSHMKTIHDAHVDDPQWFVTNLTINDTVDQYGQPLLTEEDMEAERRAGMPESLIQQEYFGSFTAALRGAYYSDELNAANKEGRIDNYPYNPMLPVYTCCDLGFSDDFAIWFFQRYEDRIIMIDYYENREKSMEFYVQVLKDKIKALGGRYSTHFAPHDIANRELIAGKSRQDAAREMGILFRTVQRPAQKIHGIFAVRHIFKKLCFDEKKCSLGLKHLSEYHSAFDEKNGVYSMQPKRNSATHCADALQTGALGYLSQYDQEGLKKQIEISNGFGALVW